MAATEEKAETIEMVEVKLQVPKAIIDFLKMFEPIYEMTPEEAMAYFIVSTVDADIENGDALNPDPVQMNRKFNLVPIFKKYGVCFDKTSWEPEKQP